MELVEVRIANRIVPVDLFVFVPSTIHSDD